MNNQPGVGLNTLKEGVWVGFLTDFRPMVKINRKSNRALHLDFCYLPTYLTIATSDLVCVCVCVCARIFFLTTNPQSTNSLSMLLRIHSGRIVRDISSGCGCGLDKA